jgi:hypothetical protein
VHKYGARAFDGSGLLSVRVLPRGARGAPAPSGRLYTAGGCISPFVKASAHLPETRSRPRNPRGSVYAVLYNPGVAKKTTVAIGAKMLRFDMPENAGPPLE